MHKKMTLAVLTALLAQGCATPSLTGSQAVNTAHGSANQEIQKFEKTSRPAAIVREIAEPVSSFKRTETARIRGDVNVKASAAPFAPVVSELAKRAGYSVAFSDGVDLNRKVTLEFSDALFEDAVRMSAFLAGYAAVIDKNRRTIMVSETATYVYKLPAGVFSTLQAQYSVGGNPANASSSGGQGGGGSGGTSLKAEFSVQGKEGNDSQGLAKFVQELAGDKSEVMVNDTGLITVRGNAQSLRRVTEFIEMFAKDAMTQVEIEASVIEVSLTNEFELGIQWNKVIQNASTGLFAGSTAAIAQATVDAATGGTTKGLIEQLAAKAVGSGGLGAYRVGVNASTLIRALSNFTDVKVVSQPKLMSMNNVPATFFDGTQLPYLGSVQQSAGTSDNQKPTVTGTVAFAIDGVSFSVVPSVLDDKTVQITLIPVLSSVHGFSEFLDGALKAPHQANKQTYMRVLAESDKTLILGGIRYSSEQAATSTGTSTGKKNIAKEIVILLRANVVPAPKFNPIVSESI